MQLVMIGYLWLVAAFFGTFAFSDSRVEFMGMSREWTPIAVGGGAVAFILMLSVGYSMWQELVHVERSREILMPLSLAIGGPPLAAIGSVLADGQSTVSLGGGVWQNAIASMASGVFVGVAVLGASMAWQRIVARMSPGVGAWLWLGQVRSLDRLAIAMAVIGVLSAFVCGGAMVLLLVVCPIAILAVLPVAFRARHVVRALQMTDAAR